MHLESESARNALFSLPAAVILAGSLRGDFLHPKQRDLAPIRIPAFGNVGTPFSPYRRGTTMAHLYSAVTSRMVTAALA